MLGRKIIAIFTFLSLIGVVSTSVVADTKAATEGWPAYPKVNYQSGVASKEVIARGEYLAKMGDCLGCHTDRKTLQSYAGGYQFPTPFGVIVSSNITPDKKTGIGNWTEKQFIRAIKEGVRPDGQYIYPAMPYNYYHQIPDADAAALYAYFMSTPAIDNPVPDNQMTWPFGWRFLQLGWRILFFNHWNKLPEFQYVSTESPEWNQGRYIVESLGHCIQCHGKLNALGAPEMEYKLTGGMILGYYAPNITGNRLKDFSNEKVMNVFRKNEMLSGGPVQGPMLEANMDSLRHLSDADLNSIAVYLKSLNITPPVVKNAGSLAPKDIYNAHCAQCHTTGGSGAPILGDKDEWNKRLQKSGGLAGIQHLAIVGIGSMPAKGTCVTCTDQQINDTVAYIIQTTENSKGVAARKSTAPPSVNYSAQAAQLVYDTHCASCHSNRNNKAAPQLGDEKAWAPILQQQFNILFSHALYGYGSMPGKKDSINAQGQLIKGYCPNCTDRDVQMAVIYMAQKANKEKDYSLW